VASVGLVLGAGGVIGHAWHAGVLAGLAEGLGWDARGADVVVGTSAGSVVAALLRADVDPLDLHGSATGGRVSTEGRRALARAGLGSAPRGPVPPPDGSRYRPASPSLLVRTAFTPWRLRPGLFLAGGLPRGRADTAGLGDAARRLHGDRWPDRPLWLCAVSLGDGRRVVLGRDEVGVPVDVGLAVQASCAIPGWFAPVQVGEGEMVDGGVHSPTNADVLAGLQLDVVLVSAPMSLDRAAARRPRSDRMARIGHRLSLQREVAVVRDEHTEVVSLQPGVDDLDVLGPTAMSLDPARRAAVAARARETTLRRIASDRLRGALAPLRTG
jgi:NTE family protein